MASNNILLIDDHPLFRAGLCSILQSGIPDLRVCEAASLEEAIKLTYPAPLLILLDVQLDGLNGLAGISLLNRTWPQAQIIVLSSDASPQSIQLALQSGASAFLSKAEEPAAVLEAVLSALQTGRTQQANQLRSEDYPADQVRLTARQCEVLTQLCQGLSNKAIGKKLGLSEFTVRGHVQMIFVQLKVSSRSEAIYKARQTGIID